MEPLKKCNPCMKNGLQDECILHHLQHMLSTKPSSFRKCIDSHTKLEPNQPRECTATLEVWPDSDKACIDKIFETPFQYEDSNECAGGFICEGQWECPGCTGKQECDRWKPKANGDRNVGGKGSSGIGGCGVTTSGVGKDVDSVDCSITDYDPYMMPYESIFYPLGLCGPQAFLCPYVPLSAPVQDKEGSGKPQNGGRPKTASNQMKKASNNRGSSNK